MQAGLVYYFISSGWTHPAGQSVTTVLAACQFAFVLSIARRIPSRSEVIGPLGRVSAFICSLLRRIV